MYSHSYATVTTLGDFGPWISKIILDLPREVRTNDINASAFSVFCARRKHDGSILMRKERGASEALPSQGYISVAAAYTCDDHGNRLPTGTHVALEVGEERLTKRIEGGVMGSQYVKNDITVTQTRAIPAATGS